MKFKPIVHQAEEGGYWAEGRFLLYLVVLLRAIVGKS